MATYVFSDVHGHAVTLDRLLERVSPGADDRIFMLGDMIDRGPDPVSVLKCCRALSEAGGCVLLGNHEDLMLDFYETSKDLTGVAAGTWLMNGGSTTLEGLDALPAAEKIDLLDWVDNLPLYAYAVAEGRNNGITLPMYAGGGVFSFDQAARFIPEPAADPRQQDPQRDERGIAHRQLDPFRQQLHIPGIRLLH